MVPILGTWEESKMGVKNFCHEECKHSLLPVNDEGDRLMRNGKLQCEIGYKQTVNSLQGRLNSEANGTPVCPILRSRFRIKQKEEKNNGERENICT